MKILRRPRAVLEYKNTQIRLRLQSVPDTQQSLLTVHHLKPNGYIRAKMTIEMNSPSELAEVIDIFQVFTQMNAIDIEKEPDM